MIPYTSHPGIGIYKIGLKQFGGLHTVKFWETRRRSGLWHANRAGKIDLFPNIMK
jgi:hypothetical protein